MKEEEEEEEANPLVNLYCGLHRDKRYILSIRETKNFFLICHSDFSPFPDVEKLKKQNANQSSSESATAPPSQKNCTPPPSHFCEAFLSKKRNFFFTPTKRVLF